MKIYVVIGHHINDLKTIVLGTFSNGEDAYKFANQEELRGYEVDVQIEYLH